MDRDSFMRIWQRVRPDVMPERAAEAAAGPPDTLGELIAGREALGELIAEREALGALYARLRRESGTCAALAAEGARFGAQALPALRAELFLRGRDAPAPEDIWTPGVLSALREICARECAWSERCARLAAALPARRSWLDELAQRAGELARGARALLTQALR